MARIEEYIDELRQSVTDAGLNYEVWWAYSGPESRPKYVKGMRKYNLLFQVAIHAHFVAVLVPLYRIYETRNDTYNIPGLIKMMKSNTNLKSEEIRFFEETYKNKAKPLWVKIGTLRNMVFGHRSKNNSVEEAFADANITPGEIKELIEITKKLLNDFTLRFNDSTHAFNLGSGKVAIKLLEDINKG